MRCLPALLLLPARRRAASLLAAGAAVLVVATLPAAASASSTQESIFEDEYRLLQLGPEEQAKTVDELVELGADTVRANVLWERYAPSPRASSRPAGFDPRDPAAYPAGAWDSLDGLVRTLKARNLGLLLTATGPLPAWASECRGSAGTRRICKPDPKAFGDFVAALGRRYSGRYADENEGGALLPAVTRWSIWNEPNQPGWLYPQFERVGGRVIGTAAHRYRRLVSAAVASLRDSGHAGDQILLGETSPVGRLSGSLGRRPIKPAEFLRELFCLDAAGRRLRGAEARVRRCAGYARLRVTGYAHHPYTRGGFQPPTTVGSTDEITLASVSRLKSVLSRGAAAGRIPGSLPIYYTEYGVQTDPPDALGVRPSVQADWLNQADWIAYRDPRIRSVAQYKLVDEPKTSSFNTGLRFIDGRAKPAWAAYRLPIWVVRLGSGVRVYGQVRPAAAGAAGEVEIQRSGSGGYTTVKRIRVTSRHGHFETTAPGSGARWRLRWTPPGGGDALVSRAARVASR